MLEERFGELAMTDDEQRAFDVAHRDFIHRVERASHYEVTVATVPAGYSVSYERQIQAGEPMVTASPAGGVTYTYTIDRAFEIAHVALPA